MNDKPAKPAIELVTLKQLCAELRVDPREARERLRLAARDAKKNPELAKSHKPQHGLAKSVALRFPRSVAINKIAERAGLTKSPDGTWRDPSMSEAA